MRDLNNFNRIEEKVIFEKLTQYIASSENILNEKSSRSNDSFNASNISKYISEIIGYISILENNRQNFAYRPILSYKKYIGRLIVFGKKVIRRMLKFYVEPIAFQQTEFNNAVTPSIGKLAEIQVELLQGIVSLQKENSNLREELAKKQDEFESKLQVISDKNDELENGYEELNNYKSSLVKRFEEIYGFTSKVNLKFDEMCSFNDKLDIKFDELRSYRSKLDIELEIVKNKNKILEESFASKMNDLAKLQEIANNQIISNEQKLLKLNELELDIFKENESNFWNKNTVSQSGEDTICAYINMVLGRPLEECTYLDLGANHAKDLSNTYLFYSHGARGVLVEANPALIPELKFYRNGDIILNKCISTNSGEYINFYVLNGDGLSTPSLESANEFISKNPSLKITDTVQIETITVNDIIENYMGKAPVIMNIDIEGKDLEILESINFEKYRPLIIIAEMIEYKPTLVVSNKNKEILDFMEKNDYLEYAFTGINSIFIDKKQIEEV
jgi:FkbM family methyltransferase